MNPYDYSKPINLWLTSDSTIYQRLVLLLRKEIEHELKANHGVTRFKAKESEDAINHILADLFVTCSSEPKRYIAFSRNKIWYSVSNRYQPKRFAFSPFVKVIDALTSLGYLDSIKGVHDKGGANSRNARMKATGKLMKLFKQEKLTVLDFYQLPNKECIILKSPKDSKGRSEKIDYEDSAKINVMRDNLKQINENIGKHWIDLKITDVQFVELQGKLAKDEDEHKNPVDFTRINLVRVFNNGDVQGPLFNQGGRFYGGWWISIPSEYRSRIKINGNKTVELDYSAMHFYLMYAEKGLAIPDGDPYTLDGIERKKAKLALNTALNASSKSKAISAIKSNQWPEKTIAEVTEILNKLLEKHGAISEFFYTGKGLELQFKDSQVAELVMLSMWNKYGIVVLPVHDSFIVPMASVDDLKVEMQTSFKAITGYSANMKASVADESLKSDLDKMAQAGVNTADTWDGYKQERDEYKGYRLRGEQSKLIDF